MALTMEKKLTTEEILLMLARDSIEINGLLNTRKVFLSTMIEITMAHYICEETGRKTPSHDVNKDLINMFKRIIKQLGPSN